MTAIENKEIKGLTVRAAITIFTSTCLIITAVVGSAYGIKSEISEIDKNVQINIKMNEVRMKSLEMRMDMIEAQIQEIKTK